MRRDERTEGRARDTQNRPSGATLSKRDYLLLNVTQFAFSLGGKTSVAMHIPRRDAERQGRKRKRERGKGSIFDQLEMHSL